MFEKQHLNQTDDGACHQTIGEHTIAGLLPVTELWNENHTVVYKRLTSNIPPRTPSSSRTVDFSSMGA
jgi:hypothetical protein